MNKNLSVSLALVAAAILAACTTVPSKQDQGMLIGAIAGGILGHQVGGGSGQVLATMFGTVAGAMIGGSVGRSMDETDQMKAALAFENVQTGVPSSWINPDTGYQYVVTPTNTFSGAAGPCREYTMNAIIGGRSEQVYGTACRQPDGSWQVVN